MQGGASAGTPADASPAAGRRVRTGCLCFSGSIRLASEKRGHICNLRHMSHPAVVERTSEGRRWDGFFLVVLVPIYHAVGGFFVLDFVLSGQYTWGRTLRTFVLLLSNLVLAFEFVYRDLCTNRPDWPRERVMKSVIMYCVIPFCVGMAVLLVLFVIK